jgi:hypothetical protein
MLGVLIALPTPCPATPAVIGVDDFALRKRQRYATVMINAETGERIDVLLGPEAEPLRAWLHEHPGVQVVCRDGSGAYAEAIRRALPAAVQADRWHLWHNLGEAVLQEVAAHSACWSKAGPPPQEDKRTTTTRERWGQVHDLRDAGVGLLEITRRLGLALNTYQTLRPHRGAGAARARIPVPAQPRRPVPRLPAREPARGARRPLAALAGGD